MSVSIRNLWIGAAPLRISFWFLFLPAQIALIAADNLADKVYPLQFMPFVLLPIFPIYCFSLISVWRCARNHDNQSAPYTILARSIVVILGLVWSLLSGLVLLMWLLG